MESKLQISTFVFNDFAENTYLLYIPQGDACIIDPGCHNDEEFDKLKRHVQDVPCRPIAVICTHAHLDHIFGVDRCRKEWDIPMLLHPDDTPLIDSAPLLAKAWGVPMDPIAPNDQTLQHGQNLTLGPYSIRVIHTPGHSPGGVCLFIEGEHPILFAGDTLFDGSIGRADLPGGNYAQLIRSIMERLMPLPDHTIVLPGHGPQTTIARERTSNPFLQ